MGIQFDKNPPNTTYFSEDLVRDGVGGCCQDVAFAIHQRTHWPLAILWEPRPLNEYDEDASLPRHVFCIAPNGQGVDVEGAHTIDALKELYIDPYRQDRPLTLCVFRTVADLADSVKDCPNAVHILPRDFRIAAAENVISRSPPFLKLLQHLSNTTPGPLAP